MTLTNIFPFLSFFYYNFKSSYSLFAEAALLTWKSEQRSLFRVRVFNIDFSFDMHFFKKINDDSIYTLLLSTDMISTCPHWFSQIFTFLNVAFFPIKKEPLSFQIQVTKIHTCMIIVTFPEVQLNNLSSIIASHSKMGWKDRKKYPSTFWLSHVSILYYFPCIVKMFCFL